MERGGNSSHYQWRWCRGLTLCILLFLATILPTANASAQPSAEGATQAAAAYQESLAAAEKAKAERAEIDQWGKKSGIDPYNSSRRRETVALDQRIHALNQAADRDRARYRQQSAIWRREIQPFLDLEASALEAIRVLRAADRPNSDVNRQRALQALETDLQRLYPESVRNLPAIMDEMSGLVRAGRPLAAIHEELSTKYNDAPSKTAIGDLVSAVRAEILKAPQLSRVAAFNKVVGNIGNLLKIAKVMNSDSGDPLATTQLSQLADLVDASKAGVGRHPVGYALGMYGLIVGDIADSARSIRHSVAMRNIQSLIDGGLRRSDPYGDLWLGLSPDVIFGLVPPNPAIIADKTNFEESEGIAGKWYGSFRYDESGWVGIVPAGTPDHETWADSKDLDYTRIVGENERGDFSFRSDLQPGNYELRMYENDSGGELLAKQAISIKSKQEETTAATPSTQSPGKETTWATSEGEMDLPENLYVGQKIRTRYNQDGGRIIALISNDSRDGLVMTGRWIEDGSSQKCATKVDGSDHWGAISFLFDEEQKSFAGLWGYCSDVPANAWTGRKR